MSRPSLNRLIPFFILLPLLAAAVVACSDDDDPPDAADVTAAAGEAREARSELCSDIEQLKDAVGKTDDLTADSTIDDAKQVQEDVRNSLDAVRESAGNTASAIITVLQTAVQAIESALSNLSGEDKLGAVATALERQASTVSATVDGLKGQAGCS